MGYRAPFPAELSRVEYVKLYFHLEIRSSFNLPPYGLLQLRRELLQVLKTLSAQQGEEFFGQLKQLLQPDFSADPVLRRQVQKPPPAVVFSPESTQHGLFEPQQRMVLPVLFIGSAINTIDPFISLLQQLGRQGLYHNAGQFVVEGVEAEDGSGLRSMLWFDGKSAPPLAPPVNYLSWWLERQPGLTSSMELEFVSPLRLLRQGRPLFKADFSVIFPHLLRRVTALLASYSDFDLIDQPGHLIALAKRVRLLKNGLDWSDWRTLKQVDGGQNLGGLLGCLSIAGDELTELLWILQLGTLFNFGKGAAYGAGQYRLNYS